MKPRRSGMIRGPEPSPSRRARAWVGTAIGGIGLALVVGCAHRPDRPAASAPPAPLPAEARPAAELEAWEVLSTRAIQRHWSQLLEEASLDGPPGGGSVEVECAVDGRGRFVRADVVDTTVDTILTRYCLRAVRDRTPLPPPPVADGGPAVGHVWRITFVYEHQPRKRR